MTLAFQNTIKKEEWIAAEYDTYFLVNVYVPNSGQGLKRIDYRKQWDSDFLHYLKGPYEKQSGNSYR